MTALGLRLSRRAKAVSALHGEVSRQMWTGLYPGKPEDEVPIGHITNGVHVLTWLAPQMSRLYDRHLGPDWQQRNGEASTWEAIECVDDGELWETHLSLKLRLLDFVRQRAMEQAEARGEARDRILSLGRVLIPDALTIGFARRFATYKRANLILADIERLVLMVNDPKRPVQFVYAGKAHPRDEPGVAQPAALPEQPARTNVLYDVVGKTIALLRADLVSGVRARWRLHRRILTGSGSTTRGSSGSMRSRSSRRMRWIRPGPPITRAFRALRRAAAGYPDRGKEPVRHLRRADHGWQLDVRGIPSRA